MRSSAPLISLDGTYGEGGGALVRTALILSALSQQPLRIENVRGGTHFPGLDAEDLIILKCLQQVTQAEVTGDHVGSNSLAFLPTQAVRNFAGDVPDIENIRRQPNALIVLSSLLPVLTRSGSYSNITAHGETYGLKALTFDYFANTVLFSLGKMGIYAEPDLIEAAFGRDSRGEVSLNVEPSHIEALAWKDRGSLRGCEAVIAVAGLSDSIAQRGIAHLENLSKHAGIPVKCRQQVVRSDKLGIFVTISAEYERGAGGATCMGSKGFRVEHLVQSAFDELLTWIRSGATTDPHLVDHILIPALLAEGTTQITTSRLTNRFLTMVWVVKQFLPIHITVKGKENEFGEVTVRRA